VLGLRSRCGHHRGELTLLVPDWPSASIQRAWISVQFPPGRALALNSSASSCTRGWPLCEYRNTSAASVMRLNMR
jgi:hypothetical protein